MNQPLPTPAANPSVTDDRHSTRLLRTWYDLAVRSAAEAAHGGNDEDALRDQQYAVERALTDHDPRFRRRLDELLVWEASLIHVFDVPADVCFICRRARQQVPARLRVRRMIRSAR